MKKQSAGASFFGPIVQLAAIVLLVGGTLPFFAPAAHGALDAYLRIPGIDGASKDSAHVRWIMISSVVAGDLNSEAQADRESSSPSVSELTVRKAGGSPDKTNAGSQSSGSGAGKVTAATPRDAASGMATGRRMHKPFTITKEIDVASPKLVQACASGQHMQEVDVDLGTARYKLEDVVISSDNKSSSGGRPIETLTFTYQKIEMTQ